MNKFAQPLMVAASLLLVGGGAGTAWLLRDHLSDAPKPDPRVAEFNTLVARVGAPEPAVRDELNFLASTTSAPLESLDAMRVSKLTRECLDLIGLMNIDHVRAFVVPAGRGEILAYHFVGPEHRARLEAVAGPNPTPERVLEIRRGLAKIATTFARLREVPDWNVKVEGTESLPPMPIMDLIRAAHQFRPPEDQPDLRTDPKIPAFAGPDGELLVQLDQYFNSPKVRAAFPPAKYPKLYANGRMLTIPAAVGEYQKPLGESVAAEMGYLLPDENPDPEAVSALTEVYAPLEGFFTAVVSFESNAR